jgi:hypothetical protein
MSADKPLSDEEREVELKKVLKPGQIIELCDTVDRLRARNRKLVEAMKSAMGNLRDCLGCDADIALDELRAAIEENDDAESE